MTSEWLLRLRPDREPPRPAAVSSPTAIAEAEADLGPGPVAWAVETAAGATERYAQQAPEVADSPAAVRSARRSSEACCLALLRGLLHDTVPDDIAVPVETVDGHRDLVHRDVALDRVLLGVWTSQVHTYERLLAAMRHFVEPDRWADESERVTRLSFAYVEKLTTIFTVQYAAEKERWAGSALAARRHVVDDLLAGRRVSPATVKRLLGLDLEHHHLAMVLWSDPPEPEDANPAVSLHHLAADLISALGATNSVLLATGTCQLWAWASWPHQPPPDLIGLPGAQLQAKVARFPAGGHAALGPCARGRSGFRDSHLAARETERVAQALGEPGVYAYADTAVLALLTAVPGHAERYMREVLGPLADPGDKTAELRETLRRYLAHGRSRNLAAEELFVAPNTVAYRVKRAEQLLGRSLPQDHLSLRLALEISRVIGL